MEVKHTPLPWKAEEGAARGAWIMGADECWSALACGDDDRTAIANTGFIVRACNSHYELLEAVQRAEAMIGLLRSTAYQVGLEGTKEWDEIVGGSDMQGTYGVILAALAKAEGRS